MTYAHYDMCIVKTYKEATIKYAKSEKSNISNHHYNQSPEGELSSREHIIITVIIL